MIKWNITYFWMCWSIYMWCWTWTGLLLNFTFLFWYSSRSNWRKFLTIIEYDVVSDGLDVFPHSTESIMLKPSLGWNWTFSQKIVQWYIKIMSKTDAIWLTAIIIGLMGIILFPLFQKNWLIFMNVFIALFSR